MLQPIQQSFEGFTQIADHMPPVEAMLRIRRAKYRAARIFC
jgi:hypothetical protein